MYVDSTSPREAFATSSCTINNGIPNTCTLKNTAPKGYALTPAFIENSAVLEFSTDDKALIKQWTANQRLFYNSTLKFRIEIEGNRCKATSKYPKATPALLDEVIFGPTSFMLNENPQHYFLRSYRAYRVSNVSGIDWSVNVTASLDKSRNKTSLTSMLMREKDYFTWADQCITNCKPPENLALRNTVCRGTYCARKYRGLGAKRGSYRLLVSYPEISSFMANSSLGETAPVKTRFKKQIVKTEIWPKVWSLEPSLQEGAKDRLVWADAEAPAPAPDAEEAVASEDQDAGEARSYMPDDTPLIKPLVNLPWNSELKHLTNG